jgi:hypothetical protein
MIRLLSMLLLVASVSLAHAQAPGETTPVVVAPVAKHKNPSTAMALSIGVTFAGTGMLLASGGEEMPALVGIGLMYFGPSTGQWYTGRVGGIGLVSRAVGAALMISAIPLLNHQGDDCLGYTDAQCSDRIAQWDRETRQGKWLLFGGLGLWVGSTLFDVVMAGRATQAWNREHAIALTPTLLPAAGGRVPGASLQLRF